MATMNGVEEVFFSCPYCGELFSVLVEPEAIAAEGDGFAEYIEDCQVCCRPMALQAAVAFDGGGRLVLEARSGQPLLTRP